MKRATGLRILLAVLLLAAAGGFWAFRSRNREKPLLLTGSIEAHDAEVGSLVGGRVVAVHVEEGARVAAGQPLVSLETDLIGLQIREQQARIEEARANLARIRRGPRQEELSRARAEWENAEKDRQRMESLLKDGVIGKQQYDAAATKARTSRCSGSGSPSVSAAARRIATTLATAPNTPPATPRPTVTATMRPTLVISLAVGDASRSAAERRS